MYTYAAPLTAEGTASGQVSAKLLRHLYRDREILESRAKIYGVIADPVRHSISPAVHNRAFQARRIDAVYLPFLVRPPHLKDFFALADKLPIAGFSVTIPHKQKIMRYLDIGRSAGAAHRRRQYGVAQGRKVAGAQHGRGRRDRAAQQALLRLAKSRVLLVGNGGAARGAACALARRRAKVTHHRPQPRSRSRAREIMRR